MIANICDKLNINVTYTFRNIEANHLITYNSFIRHNIQGRWIKMKKIISVRWGNTSQDYENLNITKQIKPWEDGIRTSGEIGTYEWWYFDSHLNDGSTLVIIFLTKPYITPELPLTPQVTFTLDRPDGTHISKIAKFKPNELKASKEITDVLIGKNIFSGNQKHYDIHIEIDEIVADIKLDNTIPAWRPSSGYMYFGDNDENYFAWLPSTPEGKVSGEIIINGKSEKILGTGYHDHNWGNIGMVQLMHHWYWGRAKIGEYTNISSYIYAREEYGYHRFPIFMLAKNGEILVDNPKYLTYTEKDETIDAVTGKPYHKYIIYDYNDGNVHYTVTYKCENIIIHRKYIDELPKDQQEAAQKSGFDSAYLRFTGKVVLERYEDNKILETIESPALWEEMYFGRSIFNQEYK